MESLPSTIAPPDHPHLIQKKHGKNEFPGFLLFFPEFANSEDPDQTAPEGAVWSGSTLFI